ncbi:unnamed protein product [Urochloa humidicola]
MARGPLDFWSEWTTQILVLLSLTLQVVLLFLAGIRRWEAPAVLRFVLWLAYQLADSTAVYAVGHLSLTSTVKEHQLVAFWAPFLLLHLGGPDNITAYALQDNQLWLRHLITLIVQVLGAAYVIYKHLIGRETLLLVASILMSVVGLAKYGERTWALKCGNMDMIRSSLDKELRRKSHFHLEDLPHGGFKAQASEEEFLLQRAQSLFHICKCAIADSSVDAELYGLDLKILDGLTKEQWEAVMEMELSLMYDILYTKAAVIHTECGYFIRIISPLAVATSLLLFQLSSKAGDSRIDVLITYILLGGAFFMEMTSLLGALGSSWTLVFLCTTRWSWLRHAVLCSGIWGRLRGAVVSFHRLGKILKIRSCWGRLSSTWPYPMGQYNMLHLCTRPRRSRGPLLGRLAKWMGFAEWWDRKHYSGKIAIPKMVNRFVFGYIFDILKARDLNTLGVIRNSWGKRTLEHWNLDEDLRRTLGVEFQEGIIIWHIGTDIFLAQSRKAKVDDVAPRVEAITAVSNYMMFLLVERPDMLPGLAQNRLYQQTCRNLEQIWSEDGGTSGSNLKDLFCLHDDPKTSRLKEREKLANILPWRTIAAGHEFPRLSSAIRVARELLRAENDNDGKTDPLKVLLELWTDILVYAANRSSKESHAKKLNSGGELTTFLWLMTEHLYQLSQ